VPGDVTQMRAAAASVSLTGMGRRQIAVDRGPWNNAPLDWRQRVPGIIRAEGLLFSKHVVGSDGEVDQNPFEDLNLAPATGEEDTLDGVPKGRRLGCAISHDQ
jgi:hypothetical protein